MTAITCDDIDDRIEDLALGQVDEPERGHLLAHVTGCARCRGHLDEMVRLTDRLLLLAPAHEPEAGFESRVLARANANWAAPRASGRIWGVVVLAAAVAVIAVLGFSMLRDGHRSDRATDAVPILRGDGTRTGAAWLVGGDHPHVVVVVDNPRPGSGEVHCVLVLADGRSARVGSWDYDDVRAHVWAVGIDAMWLDAVRMDVVLDDGTVVASAELA